MKSSPSAISKGPRFGLFASSQHGTDGYYWSTNRWIESDHSECILFARKLCREAGRNAARDRAAGKYAKAVASNTTVHA